MPSQKELNRQLLRAAECGEIDQLITALRSGSAVNCTDAYLKTPLHNAAEGGYSDIVNVLINSKADMESKDEDGWTPLIYASDNGHTEVVQLLLEAGANKDIVDPKGWTPLIYASYKRHADIVQLLLAAGAKKDIANNKGWTPLICASWKGHNQTVQLLLAAGANRDIVDHRGSTPLICASYKGHTKVVQLLLAAGADKDIADQSGNTALDHARHEGYEEIVQLLEGKAIDTEQKWDVDNFDEEQVFEKPEYGVKLVIPSLSVQENQSIDTTIQIIKSDVILPPNVEPVSCFYKIGTSRSFVKPVRLHIQHNVDVASADKTRLAFVTSSGSPPYQMEFCDVNDQTFDLNDNSGVVRISHFSTCVFGIVWLQKVAGKVLRPSRSYAMTPFYKQIDDHCWQLKVVITQNLGPFFEKLKTLYNGWIKKDSGSFYFNPDVNTVTVNEYNQYFDITSLKTPQVDKDEVDGCPFDSEAFPLLHVQIKLKPSCSVSPLKIEFEGMMKKSFIVITEPELTSRTCNVISEITLSDELLAKEPRKNHLISQLNSIKFQWYLIGEQLEVQDGDLKTIQLNPLFSSDSLKLSEVFQKWSDVRSVEVSWKKILDVIRDPPIENKRLELEIRKFLSRYDIQRIYVSPKSGTDVNQKTFVMTPSLEEATNPPPVAIKPPPVANESKPSSDNEPIPVDEINDKTVLLEGQQNLCCCILL